MIITSPVELEAGKIYTEKFFKLPFDMCGKLHFNYRFMVMRVATLEEYRAYIISEYDNSDIIANLIFFYEISMD